MAGIFDYQWKYYLIHTDYAISPSKLICNRILMALLISGSAARYRLFAIKASLCFVNVLGQRYRRAQCDVRPSVIGAIQDAAISSLMMLRSPAMNEASGDRLRLRHFRSSELGMRVAVHPK